MTITGSTRLFAIVGAPVAPLRSPALFNAAFAKLGHDAVFVAFEVAQGELPAAWQSYRSAAAPPGAPSPSHWLARERAPSCFTMQRPGAPMRSRPRWRPAFPPSRCPPGRLRRVVTTSW